MAVALYLPLIFSVLAFVFYNVFQKSIAHGADPYLTLIVNYIVAGAAAVIAYLVTKGNPISVVEDIRQLNWAAYLLGFSVFGIEIGVLLLYRNGWNLSTASLIINVAVAVILIPLGLILFKEHISILNYLGILLCLGGLFLVVKF